MSHTTRVNEVRVHNKAALLAAVEQVQQKHGVRITVKENAECRLWASQRAKCDVVLSIAGCRFDVGFQQAKDGAGLTPIFDSHGNELYQYLGQGREVAQTSEEKAMMHIGKLMQEYAYQALYAEAMTQSASVDVAVNEANQYVMTVQQY